MNTLSKRCKNIEYLSLCYCDQVKKEGFEAISALESLVLIDLTGCSCNDQVFNFVIKQIRKNKTT
jgi:hypothetical protein